MGLKEIIGMIEAPSIQDFILHLGVFDYEVRFIIGGDLKKVVLLIKDVRPGIDISEDDFECRGKVLHYQEYSPILWLPKKPVTTREQATLAHECVHVALGLLRWSGMWVTPSSEEVVSHTVGFLYHKAMERMK